MRPLIIILALVLISACQQGKSTHQEHKNLAEQLLRSVYVGDTARINDMVSDDIVSTYPVFSQLFGTSALRGREAYEKFAMGFSERWNDAKIIFQEAIAEDTSVVLVWSFIATRMTTTPDSSFVAGREYSWGGITLFHFNESGKITAEIGEESSPGPIGRLKPNLNSQQ